MKAGEVTAPLGRHALRATRSPAGEGSLARPYARCRLSFRLTGANPPHIPGAGVQGTGDIGQSPASVIVLRGVVLDTRNKSHHSLSGISHRKAEIGLAPMGRMRVF
jgi:hypothetical protein